MKYPNLTDLVKYHPYHQDTFMDWANVDESLFKAVLYGEEELLLKELLNICRLVDVPFSVLANPRLITLDKSRWKHRCMMDELKCMLYAIWEWQKKGEEYAVRYMRYNRGDYVNMALDFQNWGKVSYCRYLGVKEYMQQTLLFISNNQKKIHNKPRGLK